MLITWLGKQNNGRTYREYYKIIILNGVMSEFVVNGA